MLVNIHNTGRFHLDDSFLSQYADKPVDWGFGALSWFVYKRTYARYLDEKRTETEDWWQTCQRVVEGTFTTLRHRCRTLYVPWDEDKGQRFAQEMYDRMFNFKFLPPGRGIWMMGTDFIYEEGGAACNNCGFVSTKDIHGDFAAPFCWSFTMLMLGVGIGFDTHGVKHNLEIPSGRPNRRGTHVIGDSRRGWRDALKVFLEAQMGQRDMPTFDYTQIRPAGAPIKRFGGTASGPDPLRECFEMLDQAFDRAKSQRDGVVDSTLIVDIMNIIGRCVVSGNVRRSAEIALGDPTDQDFLQLKSIEQMEKRPWFWASNNSVTITEDYDGDYSEFVGAIAESGEPGFFWIDNARAYGRMGDAPNYKDSRVMGVNPCVEQSLEPWELCCLVETFPAKHDTLEDFKRTLKFAYLYAKVVTLLPTHDERTNSVMRANARIGCSMSGIVQNIEKQGYREHFRWCDEGYAHVQELDEEYSRWMCAPRSIKTTSVKPSGTVSLLAGATPGIHFDHAPHYIRRVRVPESSDYWQKCERAGYVVEDDKHSPRTKIVQFPVKAKHLTRGKSEVSIWEQFSLAAKMQRHWADNQVSATITFKEEETDDIGPCLNTFEDQLKGVSLLKLDTTAYEQAPYETITEDEYEEMLANVRDLDLSDTGHEETERFCDGETCKV
jgi:adenosylcobalamin-dependent ribonucleoside-triphosphate reductase